jgi:hypothetical protein
MRGGLVQTCAAAWSKHGSHATALGTVAAILQTSPVAHPSCLIHALSPLTPPPPATSSLGNRLLAKVGKHLDVMPVS